MDLPVDPLLLLGAVIGDSCLGPHSVVMILWLTLVKPGPRVSWKGLCGLAALFVVAVLGGIGLASLCCREEPSSFGSLLEENESHNWSLMYSSRRATAVEQQNREASREVSVHTPRSGARMMTHKQRGLQLFGDEATVRRRILLLPRVKCVV